MRTRRARIDRDGTTVDHRGLHGPWPSRKGDEIGADRFRFGEPKGERRGGIYRRDPSIRDGGPVARGRKRESDAPLQIALIEAGKELVRVGRNAEGVQIVRVVDGVVNANHAGARGRDRRLKVERDLILAIAKCSGRDDEMPMLGARRRGRSVRHDIGVPQPAKIENDVAAAAAYEAHARMADRGVAASDVELQCVAHLSDLRRSALRQRTRHAWTGKTVSRDAGNDGCQQKREEWQQGHMAVPESVVRMPVSYTHLRAHETR